MRRPYRLASALLLTLLAHASLAATPAPPDRGVENLIAFTRLLGYVRYFHPSDGVITTDWDRLAVSGVRVVEAARSPDELAHALERVFRPIAPSVRIVPTGTPFEPLGGKRGDRSLVFVHHWRSERVDTMDPAAIGQARYRRTFDAAPFRGKTVRFAVSAWSDGSAELFLRASTGEDALGRDAATAEEAQALLVTRSVRRGAWDDYELELRIPPEATAIGFGLELTGPGNARIDGAPLQTADWHLDAMAVTGQYRLSHDESGVLIDGSKVEPHPFSRLEQPWIVDLEGGVTARVPLTVRADASGTLPRGALDSIPLVEDDRSAHLAAIALGWNVIQHFHAYLDSLDVDWRRVLRVALTRAASDADDRAFVDTLREMLGALRDGHAFVNHASDRTNHRPPFVWRWIDGRVVVTHVLEGETDEVYPGDAVLAIDGVPVTEGLARAALRVSAATRQYRRYWSLLYLGAGVGEQPVTLDFERPGGERKSVTTTLKPARLTMDEPRPEVVAHLAPGILYADLTRLTTDGFREALDEFAAAEGIVLDLRGYPRVDVPALLAHLTDIPLRSPPIYKAVQILPDRSEMNFTEAGWSIQPAKPRLRGRIAVLTDGRAISTAETLLAIVKRYGLADIVGEASAGTNGGAQRETLPGGFRFMWTGSRVTNHDGSPHYGVGVLPDNPVERTSEGATERRDEVLERAVRLVSPGDSPLPD